MGKITISQNAFLKINFLFYKYTYRIWPFKDQLCLLLYLFVKSKHTHTHIPHIYTNMYMYTF